MAVVGVGHVVGTVAHGSAVVVVEGAAARVVVTAVVGIAVVVAVIVAVVEVDAAEGVRGREVLVAELAAIEVLPARDEQEQG